MKLKSIMLGFTTVAFYLSAFGSDITNGTLEEIEAWSLATGYGGIVELHEHQGHQALVVMRSYTSGRRSSDATVFVKYKDEWTRVLHRDVLYGEHISVEKTWDGNLVFTTNERRLILIVPISGLYGGPGGRRISE